MSLSVQLLQPVDSSLWFWQSWQEGIIKINVWFFPGRWKAFPSQLMNSLDSDLIEAGICSIWGLLWVTHIDKCYVRHVWSTGDHANVCALVHIVIVKYSKHHSQHNTSHWFPINRAVAHFCTQMKPHLSNMTAVCLWLFHHLLHLNCKSETTSRSRVDAKY